MSRDGILFGAELLSAAGTVVAIAIAVYAAIAANRAQLQAHEALIRERRIDFELVQLTELARYNALEHNVFGATANFWLAASLLPESLVEVARSSVGLPSTPEANAFVDSRRQAALEAGQAIRDFLRQDIHEEIQRAVARRLAERDQDQTGSGWAARLPRWLRPRG
jgi:hypothetical protein